MTFINLSTIKCTFYAISTIKSNFINSFLSFVLTEKITVLANEYSHMGSRMRWDFRLS